MTKSSPHTQEEKKSKIIGLIGSIFLLLLMFYLLYQTGNNGRLIRDLGGSGINDNQVKSIWCNNLGFSGEYISNSSGEFCGNTNVRVDCRFTNSGDHCVIKEVTPHD